VFVLTSDQGFFYGEFGLAQERRLPYEPSIRIPLIVRYPAMTTPGSTVTQMATNLDVAPTLLELGNVLPPRDMAGQSLVPLMRDGVELARPPEFLIEYFSDEVFERIVDMGYKALRTDRYKYIRYEHLEGMDELYDLTVDPHEMDNVRDRVDPDVIATLDASLDRILRSTGPGAP
jgi:arylsulfatase A-like enzyme